MPRERHDRLFGAVTARGILGQSHHGLLLPCFCCWNLDAPAALLRLIHQRTEARRSDRARGDDEVGAWLGDNCCWGGQRTSTTIALCAGLPGYFYVLARGRCRELFPHRPRAGCCAAILLGFTVSPQTALFVALYCWGQQFVENNFLVPRIMERQVGVSPVTIIVALLVGSTLLGFVGAILAVPSAAIAQVLYQEFMTKAEEDAD